MLPLIIRPAQENDIVAIVALFAADDLGGHGDTTDPDALPDYLAAFRRIAASSNEVLYVAERDGAVVGTFQTMITTTLTGRGSSSMIVEAVQTRADCRGQGIGAQMIEFCLERARAEGLRLVQLSSNAVRLDAHRFYERLGFSKSHFGFKFKLK
ncbi:N-acetyltransferase family protein [Agrobacterium vitis]|uniref:GNAT family N-acetyltransferase n=1 Tax=Rhizobium/Agrobacterium group TaxID=227290 RepID=UPI0008DBFD12|nr:MULTISPECIES: GNAT family N-acetyltransferase [Rhizobium/Agrobacterium group]MCF1434171.1 GNAT family N-acetyltransferase [Allorhizobium ampelinum]MCF1481808.1 GNAT family N-acetyltransferase [Allorhizobium ampelinum]MCF1494897.1 GNAT family N-acetyltransferase [Allorhizobium ampelinum]MUO90111.1 GNAT family N-acetyltransferase [Agrobacterium vitis]MUZ51819.1 GNAT family N-acetyltransferase [Agrobacterium vitis]